MDNAAVAVNAAIVSTLLHAAFTSAQFHCVFVIDASASVNNVSQYVGQQLLPLGEQHPPGHVGLKRAPCQLQQAHHFAYQARSLDVLLAKSS
eukprot:993481-Pleurochrysis_carterae.AAC.2